METTRESLVDIGLSVDPGRWIRDFVGLGLGVGALAPLVWVGPMLFFNTGTMVMASVALLGVTALVGAACGVIVGAVMVGLGQLLQRRIMLLLPVGFPVGFLAGGTVGWIGGSTLASQAAPLGAILGGMTGGMVLGLLWLPYVAMQLRGRPGWPVFALGAFLSPAAGAMALVSVFALGI